MNVLLWIALGTAVGMLGALLQRNGRTISTSAVLVSLGVLGALMGGFAGRAMGFYSSIARPGALGAAAAGAVLLLALYFAVFAGRRLY